MILRNALADTEPMSEPMADSNSSLIIDVLARLPLSSRPWGEEKFLVAETYHDPGYICLPTTTNGQGSLQWVLAIWKKSGLMLRRAIWKQLTLHYLTTLATSYYTPVGT